MKSSLHHVSVFTNDLDRSLWLYKDLLGFETLWKVGPLGGKGLASLFGLKDINVVLVMLQGAGGLQVELIHTLAPSLDAPAGPPALPAPVSLALEVNDLDGLHHRLGKEGWTPLTPVTKIPGPAGDSVRLFCIRTEENVLLEFLEAPSA
jgi:catechol 2,3-dioxygenase-like lactoylglutathione lyase family enzyme